MMSPTMVNIRTHPESRCMRVALFTAPAKKRRSIADLTATKKVTTTMTTRNTRPSQLHTGSILQMRIRKHLMLMC